MPTTDKIVHFVHTAQQLNDGNKEFTFVSAGRYEGSYLRKIVARTLKAAQEKLREDFPGARF